MTAVRLICTTFICCIPFLIEGHALQAPLPVPASAVIRDVQPVALPTYESNRRIALFTPTQEEYERVAADRTFVMERITYRSDDLDVYAYLYRPTAPPRNARLPVVVFNRGSYVRDDFSYELLLMAHRLARHGYVVIAPMLRGSGGAKGQDEMGGADLRDILNVVPVIKEISYTDPARVFLYGESRGGIMSLLAAKENFPARAVAIWGAITDMSAYLAANPAIRKLASAIVPDFEQNERAFTDTRSALHWPERIDLPVLIMNGALDTEVPPTHARQLAAALHKLGRPHELKIFEAEGHIASARAQERNEEVVRWFRRFDVTR